VSDSRAWTRTRLCLALLLAALVAGAVPIRVPASRGEKASGTAAWRAAAARPLAPRPHLDLRGFPPVAPGLAELLPPARVVRIARHEAPRATPPAPAFARSPLPRAPPLP